MRRASPQGADATPSDGFKQQHEEASVDMAPYLVPVLQEFVDATYGAVLRDDEYGRAVE